MRKFCDGTDLASKKRQVSTATRESLFFEEDGAVTGGGVPRALATGLNGLPNYSFLLLWFLDSCFLDHVTERAVACKVAIIGYAFLSLYVSCLCWSLIISLCAKRESLSVIS